MGSTYVLRKGEASLADLTDGFAGYPGEGYTGTQYFVNNITGDSGFSGLSWKEPFAQVSQAITASEAQRLLQGTSTNDYVRNQIYVQGTGTAYTALVELPHYCDLIGVGADPRGNGVGIARIGADAGSTISGVLEDATVRGLNVSNIQFQGGKDGYAFKGTNFYRCVFDNVVFATNGSPGGDMLVYFEAANCSGLVMRNCHWLNQTSAISGGLIGINITGTHFHGCLIENCFIVGVTAGIVIASGCINGHGSIVRNNYIGMSGETCVVGVDDNATTGSIVYAGNYIAATATNALANNHALRWAGNYAINNFTDVVSG